MGKAADTRQLAYFEASPIVEASSNPFLKKGEKGPLKEADRAFIERLFEHLAGNIPGLNTKHSLVELTREVRYAILQLQLIAAIGDSEARTIIRKYERQCHKKVVAELHAILSEN